MPLPAIVPIAATVAQNVGNLFAQIGQNKKAREHQEYMYDKARTDALADRAFENEYNSPAAQMERLKQAGLNPNLVYGSGNAQTTSTQTRATPTGNAEMKAPSIQGFSEVLNQIYNLQKVQAQTDNLRAQRELIIAQTDETKESSNLKQFQGVKTSLESNRLNQDLEYYTATQQTRINKAMADLQNLEAQTKVHLENNERQKLLTANTLAKGVEEVLTMRMQRAKTASEIAELEQKIALLQKDNKLKEFDVNLSGLGLKPSDSPAWRYALMLLNTTF